MKLPPLNALKAYEAAARTGSFVAAAVELGVSSAAVSMQVRNLERFLNKKLFTRSNNRITLTDAGRAVYPGSASALTAIATMTEQLLEGEVRAQLVISTLPALGERWLAQKLAGFARAEPDIGIEIRIEDDPVDFVGERIDVRIAYGNFFYPDFRARELFHDAVTPLCSAGFAERFDADAALAGLGDAHLIHVDWGEAFASHPSWSDWFRAAGIMRQPDMRKGTKTASTGLATRLAVEGMGVVLGQTQLAAAERAAGRLIAPSPTIVKLAHPYCAVSPHAKARHKPVTRVLDWLVEEAT